MKKIRIAIDGPAGAGKSSIARVISKQLGIIYLDTGAMYRTVALKAIKMGIDTLDRAALARMVKDINMDIKFVNDEQQVYLDGENVTDLIRTPEVSKGASDVASIPEVRLKMVELQRMISSEYGVVMDGRDIGTYVLPDADLKIFLTASIEERVRRRYNELVSKGISGVNIEQVRKDIEYRDKNDSLRSFAPLRKADDAIEIDTTGLSMDDVADKIRLIIKEKNL